MLGSGWETLLEVRKWSVTLPEVWNWSGDPPGGPKVVGRPSRRSGTDWQTLPKIQKWSGGSPEGSEVFGRPSRKSGSIWEALPEIREW